MHAQEAAAALIADPPPDPDARHRVDLTHHAAIAIDDASTTEVDDALSVEWLPDGRPRLWVHVADPGRWLRPGGALDLEARRRGSTMYLPTGEARSSSLPLPFSLPGWIWGQLLVALSKQRVFVCVLCVFVCRMTCCCPRLAPAA
jgi:exoribonuclease-2